MRAFAVAGSVLLLAGALLGAGLPMQMNYQGFLTRPDGSPLDTVVSITFGLYQNPSGGTAAWTQTLSACTVRAGLFQVPVGPIEDVDSTFRPDTCYLGITVGNNSEMVPRSRILAVPFAWMVSSLDGAEGGHVQGPVYVDRDLWVDTLQCSYGIRFGDHSWQSSAWDTAALSQRINLKADSAGNATRAWTNTQLALKQAYVDTSTWDATRAWTNTQLALKQANADTNTWDATRAWVLSRGYVTSAQAYSDTNTWDATRTWVRSMGYLKGSNNVVHSLGAFVGGGENNKARGAYSVIAGGGGSSPADSNSATGLNAAICGGDGNRVAGYHGFVGGGGSNSASGMYAVIGGGYRNATTTGEAPFVGGGMNNYASAHAAVCGGDSNRADGSSSFVGGGNANIASGGMAAVSGGVQNLAMGTASAVGGGGNNTVYGDYAVISGGGGYSPSDANTASGDYSAVGGGRNNQAGGFGATVPGGQYCSANGDYSFAAGYHARAIHASSFVWADGQANDYYSDGVNSFNVRAFGGVKMYTSASNGARLPAGESAWVAISDSTKKTDIRPVNTRSILDKVTQLPIKEWRYKEQPDPAIRHIGPMAQDFWNLFHVGEDSLGISTIDPDGIALAAIQELAKQVNALKDENVLLRTQVQTLLADKQKAMKEDK